MSGQSEIGFQQRKPLVQPAHIPAQIKTHSSPMTEPSNPLLPVVLCGGSGTRLWPLSRETYPKQFLALTGARTMLQETALRLQGLSGIPVAKAPILVSNVEHRFLAASQLLEAGIHGARIVLEPVGRNTAPALTLAALQAQADGGDPILLAMPADHVMANLPAFHAAIERAFACKQRCHGHLWHRCRQTRNGLWLHPVWASP